MVEELIRPLDPEAPRTMRLPWVVETAPYARRTMVEDLRMLEVPPTVVDEAEIVVAELVSNALKHARPLPDGGLRMRWKAKGGVVEVEVTDGGGPTVPRPAPVTVWSTSGRGLRIVSISPGSVDTEMGSRVGRHRGQDRPHRLGLPRRTIAAPHPLSARRGPVADCMPFACLPLLPCGPCVHRCGWLAVAGSLSS